MSQAYRLQRPFISKALRDRVAAQARYRSPGRAQRRSSWNLVEGNPDDDPDAELRQEIEKAGDEPIRIEDPETHATYVLLRAEVYDRLRPPPAPEDVACSSMQIPEGIRRSKEAFLRDLPELMARKRLRGRWVLYHGEKRVGIWRNPRG